MRPLNHSDFIVRPGTESDREVASRLLGVSLPEFLVGTPGRGAGLLFVAVRSGRVEAALWTRFLTGRTAALLGPASAAASADMDRPDISDRLLVASHDRLKELGIQRTQTLTALDDWYRIRLLEDHGYHEVTEIHFLLRPTQPDVSWEGDAVTRGESPWLTFVAANEETWGPTFNELVRATYADSKDCAAFESLPGEENIPHDGGDVAVERLDFIVKFEREPVGVLCLERVKSAEDTELRYMGLIPSARGRGWGRAIVRYAAEWCREHQAGNLHAICDAANAPALDVYYACGFIRYDQRRLMVR